MDLPCNDFDVDVDAVITWVDGADPAHRAKLRACIGADANHHPAASATRFGDCGEIDYCVSSLFRFAPWLRCIYIVTDAQTPALVARLRGSEFESRVRVVDHTEIFTGLEQHLPTFSSLSIESVLWRIPELAERFIYLNDDFQLLRPVSARDFFRDDCVVLRGEWRAGLRRRLGVRLKGLLAAALGRSGRPASTSNHSAQQLTARMVGFEDRYLQVPHCPHPMRKSVLAGYFRDHAEQLAANVTPRVRAAGQFLLVSLADHLELKAGTAIIDNRLRTLRLKPASQSVFRLRRRLARADVDERLAFGCVQSLDIAPAPAKRLILQWLERRIGRANGMPADP